MNAVAPRQPDDSPGRLRLALVAGALLAAACGPVSSSPDASARPRPTGAGVPLGQPVVKGIGAAGGSLSSDDGLLRLDIPAGVVTTPTDFKIQQVVNLAPGAVGSAYRLEPEGTTFATAVSLTFQAEAAGAALDELWVAYQEGQGYWLRVSPSELTREPGTKTVTVQTRHFSGWSLVSGPTARDLHGSFTLDSTLDVPFTGASGSATFTFAGEDPGVAYYLLAGDLTLPTVTLGTATCTPTPPESPTLALNTNVAELRTAPPAFLWGTSAHWNLTCTGPSGSSTQLLLTAFDTQRVSHFECAQDYQAGQPVLFGPDRVRGTWAIDCGAKGTAVASWDLLSNACGAACTPTQPCHTAAYACESGTATCTDTGLVPDGQPGGCLSPQLCLAGVCSP